MFKRVLKKIHHWIIPHKGNNYRPYSLRHGALTVYSAFLIGVKVFVLALIFFTYPSPAEFSTITVNRIIELTNQERQALGLSSLRHNKILDLAAQKKARDMLEHNYFAHND